MTKSSFCFLHAADLHLDSPLRGLERYAEAPVDAVRGATRRAFENLIQRARELRVAFVVLAGDVFDGDLRDFNSALWFAARLRELTTAGIRVYVLAGNHDADCKMTREIEWPSGVHAFATTAPETIVDEPTGTVLHGQGFAKAATTANLASGYPMATAGAFNVGVLHTALDGREGHDPYAPCAKDTLISKGYDYWALGHVHRREEIARDPWIVFPGNLQARHARETGEKGATLVRVENGRITSVAHESFDVVRFARLRVDVSAAKRVAECVDGVGKALAQAKNDADGRLLAARVELMGATAAHGDLLGRRDTFLTECRDLANALGDVWIEKLEMATRRLQNGGGEYLVERLELDADDLVCEAVTAARVDLEALFEKVPPGMDLGAEGLNLRDYAALAAMASDARDEVVRRLFEAAGGAATENQL
jgi:DNA repair exonuclease SbcCD nuclease subunit